MRGHVDHALSLSFEDILRLPRVELAAVNQCSGNSRGLFWPRVPGAQWANGAMGNAKWTGVRLKDVLDRAGVKNGAVQVRLKGLDEAVVPDAPDFRKSLAIDHARDGDVMIAFAMNGEQLPLLNGFPLRLVVPGWYSTYWVKMLCDIEVGDKPDDNYWMALAYTIPDTPHANIAPGQSGVKMIPINRMVQANPRDPLFDDGACGLDAGLGSGAASDKIHDRRSSHGRRAVPRRHGGGCDKQQLPGLSLCRHGLDITAKSLASRAAMRARNFARLFQQQTGIIPADFIETARAVLARRRLEDSRSSRCQRQTRSARRLKA